MQTGSRPTNVSAIILQATKLSRTNSGFHDVDGAQWLVMTTLSFCAVLLLPRQFHVTVTENNSETELRRAAWMFPLYLVLINIFVLPIAAAGLVFLGPNVDADSFVLTLPLSFEAPIVSLAAFIGGLSAATAMVIVASVALAIMRADYDSPMAGQTRRTIFERYCDTPTLICTAHFPTPSIGRLTRWDDGFRIS